MKFKIHRLCRDNDTIRRLKKEEKEYNLPQTEYVTGIDLFTFINNIIDNCTDDYALIVHDDVILPMNISDNVEECIKSANDFLGEDNWGVIGNAGVEVFTKKVLLYLSDPNIKMIVPSTEHPELVESIDGNTMLLNLKNIRRKKIRLPNSLSGFHLYDLILSLEIQKCNLVCAVSSLLYSRHSSGGSRDNFNGTVVRKIFQDYFSQNYSDTVITSINGDIKINRQATNNKSIKLEDIVRDNVVNIFKEKSFKLYFIIGFDKETTRIDRLVNSIKSFKKQVSPKIEIKIAFITSCNNKKGKAFLQKFKTRYPSLEIFNINIDERQEYFQQLSENIPLDTDTYVSIISDNYTISSNWGLYLQYLLSSSDVIISHSGDTENIDIHGSLIQELFSGDPNSQHSLLNSMIFNSTLLEKVKGKDLLAPRGLENYIIFLYSTKNKTYKMFKSPFYKIPNTSSRDKNKLGYEYTTIMAQLVNQGLIPSSYFDYFSARENHWCKIVDQLYFKTTTSKHTFVGEIINKYRSIRGKRRITNQ